MNDGIRDELRELLFDSAPAPAVDTAAMFERTFAAAGPDGADLLPPDGLFDLPDDDPADEVTIDDDLTVDDVLPADPEVHDSTPEDAPADDLAVDVDHAEPAWDADGDAPAHAPDAPFDDHGTGAGW